MHPQSVEGQPHIVRQIRFGGRMAEVVADMRKKCPLRSHGRGCIQRLLHAHVCRVRAMAQRIDHQDLHAASGIQRRRGDAVAVRKIGQQRTAKLRKNITCRFEPAVRKRHRRDFQIAEHEGPRDFVNLRANVVAKGSRASVECELKDAPKVTQHIRRGVDRHLPVLRLAITAQVVEPHHMIRVRMRVEHGVDAADVLAQGLRAKVRRRVDDELDGRRAHPRRGAKPRIPRVLRAAHRAIARDHRDALRRARAKEGNFEPRRHFHSGWEAVIFEGFAAMLASLRIRNFALVESLAWDIPAGFVAITGETGAGKSILIGGLNLLLGERADKSAIRSGENECVIEAAVALAAESSIHAILAEAGIEPCEDGQLLLKRVVSAAGTGRQFVNGSPCTLALLRQIGDRLIDLHGPHDHQSLFSREAQTRLLDAFGGSESTLAGYRAARSGWLSLEREQAGSEASSQAREREIALLTHQTEEIEAAALEPGEEEALLARQQTAANGRRLKELAIGAAQALGEAEDSVENRLAEVGRMIRDLARLDPSQDGFANRHNALIEEAGGLAKSLISYAGHIDADPRSLADIEARLDLIIALKRKYGSTIADIISFGVEASARLAAMRSQAERSANLETEIAAAKKQALAAGAKLSKLRAAAAPKLAASVRKHLADLGFLKAGFEIRLDACEPGPDGLEAGEFVFAPNPGEPAQPLRSIASSGEISRVMLALKTTLAAQDEVPVLVFDEIDANVGGEIAHSVGAKMREIGACRQVLCITHLPQVAASAAAHFVVSKSVVGGRTISTLTPVAAGGREEEIARMLGSRSGEAALAHARELLGA